VVGRLSPIYKWAIDLPTPGCDAPTSSAENSLLNSGNDKRRPAATEDVCFEKDETHCKVFPVAGYSRNTILHLQYSFLSLPRFHLPSRYLVCPRQTVRRSVLNNLFEIWSVPFAHRPRRHCVRWGPRSPPKRGGGTALPQFSAHVCSGQTAGWITMSLGTEVGLSPGHIV